MTETNKSKTKADLSALTHREREVLRLIAEGLSVSEISKVLYRSGKTIQSHRLSIGRKLGARNRVELTRIAVEAGLVPAHPQEEAEAAVSGLGSVLAEPMVECAWQPDQQSLLFVWALAQHRRWFTPTTGPLAQLPTLAGPCGLWENMQSLAPQSRTKVYTTLQTIPTSTEATYDLEYICQQADGSWLPLREIGHRLHIPGLGEVMVGFITLMEKKA